MSLYLDGLDLKNITVSTRQT